MPASCQLLCGFCSARRWFQFYRFADPSQFAVPTVQHSWGLRTTKERIQDCLYWWRFVWNIGAVQSFMQSRNCEVFITLICDLKILHVYFYRYYKGTTVYVNAIANIKAGSQIAENYGPLYSQDPIEERKKLLKNQYWFDCNCYACQNRWPEYNRFKTNELRFK